MCFIGLRSVSSGQESALQDSWVCFSMQAVAAREADTDCSVISLSCEADGPKFVSPCTKHEDIPAGGPLSCLHVMPWLWSQTSRAPHSPLSAINIMAPT